MLATMLLLSQFIAARAGYLLFLEGQPAPGHRDAHWIVLGRPLGQQFIDAHHHDAALPTGTTHGQLASISEMTATGSGQAMPNFGSSQRKPCSLAGA